MLGEAKEKPAYAVVESVGPEVKGVKKGDKIIFKEYSTTEVKIDDEEYIIQMYNYPILAKIPNLIQSGSKQSEYYYYYGGRKKKKDN